jgi:hypothetical protein
MYKEKVINYRMQRNGLGDSFRALADNAHIPYATLNSLDNN